MVRRLGNVYVQHHPELQALHLLNVPEWDPQLRRAASLLVFNFGLWRAFGTDTFAKAVGFVTSAWTEEIQEQVVEKAVESWLSGRFTYLWLVGNGRMVVMVLIIVPILPFPTNQR